MSLITWLCVFVFRLLNAFSIKTFFQPDEYFQALEPAHRLVFGYGYLTWEWHEALRSSLHPLLYAAAYKAFDVFMPESWAVIAAPKVTGALIATVSDIYVYKLARKYWRNQGVANTALAMSLLSSWNWFVSTRSFLNNLEMALTVAGLSYWPWHHYKLMPLLLSSFLGFLSCIVRPTNAILWSFLATSLIIKNIQKFSRLASLLMAVSIILALLLFVTSLADRYFYQKWTFPLYNFLEFNVVKNLLVFYGSAPWHFYLFQGVPLMLLGYLPAFFLAMYESKDSLLFGLCAFFVAAFSSIAHKEFRFLQPIYPVMLVLCAKTTYRKRTMRFLKVLVSLIVFIHIGVAYFFTRVNEIGEIEIIEVLRTDPTVKSIGLLTPCHSTPWHSVLHRKDLVKESWFLTCEPPLHLESGTAENVKLYRDQLDQFFDNPSLFLRNLPYDWPTHLVIYQSMEAEVKRELPDYYECKRLFNSFFHWDERRKGDIIVLCRDQTVSQ